MHRVLTAVVSILSVLSVATAQASKPPLRVALSGELPPLHSQAKGAWVGLEPELAQALGKQLGRSVEFVDLESLDKSSFEALTAGDVDVSLNSITASAEPAAGTALTSPYATLHLRLACKPAKKVASLAEVQGRVGVLDKAARDLVLKAMPGVEVVAQRSIKEAVVALMRGQVAYLAADGAVLRAAIQDTNLQILSPVVGEVALVMAVRSDDKDAMDAALAKLSKPMAQLQATWLPDATAGGDLGAPLAALPAEWTELMSRKGKLIIPVYCNAATARIQLSQRDEGWHILFNLGADSVEGRIHKVEVLGKDHLRIHYLQQSVEVRHKPGSKTAEWGKSTELWKGAWRTFVDAAHEDSYGAYQVEKCAEGEAASGN